MAKTVPRPGDGEALCAVRLFQELQNGRADAVGRPHDLVITGIPRSGTSLLCNLLHRYSNCVVINEPPGAGTALLQGNLAHFYGAWRRDISAGQAVRNKFQNGGLAQDTALEHTVTEYHPQVANRDFLFGTKNTLSYLTCLPALRRALPDARIVACVREPFATIASWKATFPHLRDAAVPQQLLDRAAASELSPQQQEELRNISSINAPAERRAAWWRYLAERVLEQQAHLTIVRYPELVLTPETVVNAILDDWPKGQLRSAFSPSQIRRKEGVLDAADGEAIRAICTGPARALGLL
jgi:hypothetical protein